MKVLLLGATGMVGAGALLEFFAYDALRADFATSDACFFCLRISSAGMSEAAYTRLTDAAPS